MEGGWVLDVSVSTCFTNPYPHSNLVARQIFSGNKCVIREVEYRIRLWIYSVNL